MKTLRSLFAIGLMAVLLTACSGNVSTDTLNWMASTYNADSPASAMSLQFSSRIENCDFSTKAQLGGTLKEANAGISIGEWLDAKMKTNPCISANEEK